MIRRVPRGLVKRARRIGQTQDPVKSMAPLPVATTLGPTCSAVFQPRRSLSTRRSLIWRLVGEGGSPPSRRRTR